jgi:hypothetical protein
MARQPSVSDAIDAAVLAALSARAHGAYSAKDIALFINRDVDRVRKSLVRLETRAAIVSALVSVTRMTKRYNQHNGSFTPVTLTTKVRHYTVRKSS